jgi:hypothetical protein
MNHRQTVSVPSEVGKQLGHGAARFAMLLELKRRSVTFMDMRKSAFDFSFHTHVLRDGFAMLSIQFRFVLE